VKRWLGLAVAAACAVAWAGAADGGPPCPKPAEVTQQHLLGFWRAEFQDRPGATLLLEKHPMYTESFSGAINRNGERARVVGDIEDGDFTMEESADGLRIQATWIGEVVDGSCGREIRGSWQAEGDKLARPFVLKKQ